MCKRCGIDKPKTNDYYHWQDYKRKTLRLTCKVCANAIANQWQQKAKAHKWMFVGERNVVGAKDVPQIVYPELPSKESEYHKNVERTDTNPRFFNWLCSGSNLPYKTCKTENK